MLSVGDSARGSRPPLDRARYSINVELAGDRWFASWRCFAWVEIAGATVRGDTLDGAVTRATAHIDDHHQQFHST
jgi:hypothetical protein